jgi:hypothetical protein
MDQPAMPGMDHGAGSPHMGHGMKSHAAPMTGGMEKSEEAQPAAGHDMPNMPNMADMPDMAQRQKKIWLLLIFSQHTRAYHNWGLADTGILLFGFLRFLSCLINEGFPICFRLQAYFLLFSFVMILVIMHMKVLSEKRKELSQAITSLLVPSGKSERIKK